MSAISKHMCEAVIFDLDGVMIDSEPFWYASQIECFAKVDINLTVSDAQSTTGTRTFDIVKMRYKQKPWNESKLNITQRQLSDMIVDKAVDYILGEGQPLPGLKNAINYFYHQKGIKKLAIARSADLCVIEATIKRLSSDEIGIKECDKFITKLSAADLAFGKPHPCVYLETAKQLNVNPMRCMAIEDSLTGTLAAKAAQMKVISIPVNYPSHNPKFIIADKVLHTLNDINDKIFDDIWGVHSKSKL
eukprot:506029_1